MNDIVDLSRRFMRKTQIGKGMQLRPDDIDLLNAIGVGQMIAEAAAEAQRKQCQERDAHRRSTSVDRIPFTSVTGGKTSKSSGTTPQPDAKDRLRQARAMCGKRGQS